jgi:cobalt-zinc-cadmium efflux system membrane fusion protein
LGAYNAGRSLCFIQGIGQEMQPSNGGLPRTAQIRILATGAVALAAVLLFVPLAREFLSARPAPALPVMVEGAFRPGHSQWSSMSWGTVATRKFPGLVTAEATVATNDDTTTQVFSPFTGQILNIAVRAGDHVEKGAALMTVAASEALQAQTDLVTAVGTQQAAQAAAHNADENERRQHALYQDGSAALKDWQQSQVDQTAARSALQTADAALTAARAKLRILGFVDHQISALEVSRKSGSPPAAAILAPLSGTVLQRLVGPGQFIQAGSSVPAFSIGNSSTLWLVGNAREEDAPQMRVGEPVEVTVAALPGRIFAAKLTWVAQGIDPTTHRLAVRAELRNPDGLLKPAMFATMLVHTGGDRVSPAVPEIAVIHEGEQSHVWVSGGGESMALRTIQPGRLQDGFLEVLKGLRPGEQVALSGSIFLDSAARPD